MITSGGAAPRHPNGELSILQIRLDLPFTTSSKCAARTTKACWTHRHGMTLGHCHGWNDYPQGLRYTLIDETHGINVLVTVNDWCDVLEGTT